MSDPCVQVFRPQLPDHSQEAQGDLVSTFGAEVDTNLGANPLHSTQQLGKAETGNFCWS